MMKSISGLIFETAYRSAGMRAFSKRKPWSKNARTAFLRPFGVRLEFTG